MDGWTNGGTNERIDGWMTVQTKRCKDGRADGRGMEGQMRRWLDRWVDGQTARVMDT